MRVIFMASALPLAALPRQAADNTSDAGNYPVSLMLYDKYLDNEPENVHGELLARIRKQLQRAGGGR